MKAITSQDNPVLKKARKLLTRKGREELNAFLLEGQKLISEAVSAGFVVEHVFVDSGALARGEAAGGEYENEAALDEKLFRELAQTVTPQPWIAVVQRPAPQAGLMKGRPEGEKENGLILILDRVGDPGNVGTLIRTALAAGMDEVWCTKGTADYLNGKAIRASAGAVLHMTVADRLGAEECIAKARGIGMKLVVCSIQGADIFQALPAGSLAIVVGSEGGGPDKAFLDAADMLAGIPMSPLSESLNAATAAAVVMYEIRRQRL